VPFSSSCVAVVGVDYRRPRCFYARDGSALDLGALRSAQEHPGARATSTWYAPVWRSSCSELASALQVHQDDRALVLGALHVIAGSGAAIQGYVEGIGLRPDGTRVLASGKSGPIPTFPPNSHVGSHRSPTCSSLAGVSRQDRGRFADHTTSTPKVRRVDFGDCGPAQPATTRSRASARYRAPGPLYGLTGCRAPGRPRAGAPLSAPGA
jgi:hypothetical protein